MVTLADIIVFSPAALALIGILVGLYKIKALEDNAGESANSVRELIKVQLSEAEKRVTGSTSLRAEVSEEFVVVHKRIDDLGVKKEAKKKVKK